MGGIVSILPILIVAVFLMTNVPYIPSDCFVLVKRPIYLLPLSILVLPFIYSYQ